MKKILTAVAAAGFAFGAWGQGAVVIDNSSSVYGPAEDVAANYYGGSFGLEVWYRNGTSYNINLINSLSGGGVGANHTAYGLLGADDGWTLAQTYAGEDSTAIPGFIQLGELQIPGVTPAGSQITIALAMWTGAHASWSDAVNAIAGKGGVVAMQVATVNYLAQSPPATPDISPGWDSAGSYLILTPLIPEPSSLSLVAVGLAALLARRRSFS